MLELKEVSKDYANQKVLRQINFTFQENTHYVLVGPSGSGKSTLLHLIAGLDSLTSGHIFFEGKDIGQYNEEEMCRHRNQHLGLMFQHHFLLPSMTAYDNLTLPAKLGGMFGTAVKSRIQNLSSILGIEGLLRKYPGELSGGEAQRMALIRALSMRPKFILCDEPTGNLDTQNGLKVIEALHLCLKESKASLVLITHDDMVANHFPRKLIMNDGKLFQQS